MLFVNGQFVSDEEARISVLDLGLLRGYGVFDFLRTYSGRPFHLREHLIRLQHSAHQVGMELPRSFAEIEAIVQHLLERNGHPESTIKIILTGGISSDQLIPQENPHLIVLVQSLKPLPREDYERGIITITTTLPRSLPTAKTLQYTPAIMALRQGLTKKAKEALYLNSKQEILEATTSNFFGFSHSGTLYTCDTDEILRGITRSVILRLAEPHFPIVKRSLALSELSTLSECFITSSNKEVLPVVQIDDHVIGDGAVGPHTRSLMTLFADYTRSSSW